MSEFYESPYMQNGKSFWLKGNLHMHTKRSDGTEEPQDAVKYYADLGYDFLGVSDHNVLASYKGIDPYGMILLPCNEISVNDSHLLHVGAKKHFSLETDVQVVLDKIKKEGSLAVMCHPSWESAFNHYSYEDLLGYKGYNGIEIYNGTCIISVGNEKATDKWDRLLGAGRKVWGFANDDSHRSRDCGKAWNVVQVKERSAGAILKALKNGAFYTSTGVEISEISCKDYEIHIKAPNAEAIAVIGELGKRLLYVEGTELNAEFPDASYVRVECFGKGDTMAWTQPFNNIGPKQKRLRALLEEKPVLKVFWSKKAPVITGKINDPLWKKAKPTRNFLTLKTGDNPKLKTTGQCILSGDTVFFAVRCEEPEMGKLKSLSGPSIWLGDSIEIYLDVEAKQRGYYQFIITPDGFTKSGVFPRNFRESQTGVRAKGCRFENGWSVEAAIPLKTLQAQVKRGTKWGLNICRNRTPVSGNFVWSLVGNSYHMPTRFGWLEF